MPTWEDVYNSADDRYGEPRSYCDQPGNQPGTFYQTYGGGGGPGGWGGYWVREGGYAVWEVQGSKFTYLNNKSLEYCHKNRQCGGPAVRLVPRRAS